MLTLIKRLEETAYNHEDGMMRGECRVKTRDLRDLLNLYHNLEGERELVTQLRRQLEEKRDTVLMSRANPDGYKLEDLAVKLREEVHHKTINIDVDIDKSFTAQNIISNNGQIVGLLFQIESIQRQSLNLLNQIAPDQGPTGKPRIGGEGQL